MNKEIEQQIIKTVETPKGFIHNNNYKIINIKKTFKFERFLKTIHVINNI